MTPPSQLRQRVQLAWRTLARELGGFGVVGGIAFLIDLSVFQALYAHAGMGAVTAKLSSTLVSMTIAFVGHRYWSFSHRARTGVKREYLLFAVVNGLTLLLGLALVAFVRYPLGQESAFVLQVANIASIAVGTVIRFFAYRQWVFPVEHAAPAPTPRCEPLDGAA
ncbi:GtrA family protein [Modestobacter italicus]|uniref:GtrA family protein n=1 Tax=Modestobacter italicus (strain DSM 44449 / CECT 9708 / BC 501) TaxID=2732864 RepID=UPI001C948ACF|nr:GtrA family protein [Modestobacter italicus]